MDKPYQPILCSLHDEYEIAIMHNKILHIKWLNNEGNCCTDFVLPKDILVKNKEEYLVVEIEKNEPLSIRLDKITLLD